MPNALPIPRCDVCRTLLDRETFAPRCSRCAALEESPRFPAPTASYDPDRRWSPIYHFTYGIRIFLSTIPYVLRTSGIKRNIAVPILITIALVVGLVAAVGVIAIWILGPGEEAGAFTRAFHAVAATLVIAALLVGAYVLFFPLARVLLAPFADAISTRVEENILGPGPGETFELRRAAGDTAHAVVAALAMLLFQAIVMLPLFFIPVAGPVLLILVGIAFTGLSAIDIAMGRKRMRFREKLSFLWRHLSLVLGLGSAVYLLLLVPIANLLAIPFGAVAGTLIFLKSEERTPLRRPSG